MGLIYNNEGKTKKPKWYNVYFSERFPFQLKDLIWVTIGVLVIAIIGKYV